MADFQMRRGDDRVMAGAVRYPTTLLPVDLTGCSLWLTAKRKIADADGAVYAIRKSTVPAIGGITVLSAAAGLFSIAINAGDTNTYPDCDIDLFYDLQLKTAAGKIQTLAVGSFVVKPDITRSTS